MSKEKILLVSCEGLGKGGVQIVLMNIVRQLSHKYIFDIILFTDEKRYYDDEFESYGGKIIRIPFYEGHSKIKKRLDFCIRGSRLYRSIKKEITKNGPYKAIHCNNFYESALCVKGATKCGIPVKIVHNHIFMVKTNIIKAFIENRYLKLIKKHSTHLIGCSLESCTSMFGEDENYKVIPNPYDDKKFIPKRDLDVPREFEITHVGNFCDNKNQIFSLEVLAEIIKRHPEAKLNLIGNCSKEYKMRIEEAIRELGVKDNVVIYPFDADIPEILEKSSAFIFPSRNEGFGIVLVEAQAMGVRCYASDTVPYITDAGGCTYMSLKDGAKKWADKIIEDYEKYQGKHIKCDCSRYEPQKVAKIFDDIYSGKM